MRIILILVMFSYGLSSYAQSITFNKTYDKGVCGLYEVIQKDTNYFGVILAGYPIVPLKAGFTRLSQDGNIEIYKEYGNSTDYQIISNLFLRNDTSIIAVGNNYNTTTKISNARVYTYNLNGDTLSTNDYFAPLGFSFYISFSTKTIDNGYLLTGEYVDSAITNGDLLIIKIDSNGVFQWFNSYGGNLFDNGLSSVQTPDGGYLTLGWTRSFGFGNSTNRDILLVKWDSIGNFKWKKTFGTPNFDSGVGISKTIDGNFLLSAGYGTATNDGRAWIAKIDTLGSILWQHQYGYNTAEFWWAKEDLSKNIVAIGAIKDTINQYGQGYIIKTDSLGNLLWSRTFQLNNNHSYFREFNFTSDGGYICSGFVFTGASGTQDAWLVKLDSLGCDSVGCPDYTTVGIQPVSNNSLRLFDIFPNPVSDHLAVKFNYPWYNIIEWQIFDLQGREILNGRDYTKEILQINTSLLQTGVYLLKLKFEGKLYTSKFIKQ